MNINLKEEAEGIVFVMIIRLEEVMNLSSPI